MNSNAAMWVNIWYLEITDPKILNDALGEMLQTSGFTIVGEKDYHFSPFGYTKTFLLSESHCALHTWPEINKTWIEVASCNQEKLLAFASLFKEKYNISPVAAIDTH